MSYKKIQKNLEELKKAYTKQDSKKINNISKKLLELDPNNADYLLILGKSYLDLGNIGEALINIMKAIKINPNDEKNFTLLLGLSKYMNDKKVLSTLQKKYPKAVSEYLAFLLLESGKKKVELSMYPLVLICQAIILIVEEQQ